MAANETPFLPEYFRPLGRPIGYEFEGLRLDNYLANHFPFFSRSAWQKRISEGATRVNQERTRIAYKLKLGDQVSYYHPPEIEPEIPADLQVLFQDPDLAALNKPAHMPMHENGAFYNHTFTKLLQKKLGAEWFPVHRLDKETSGIVLCAKSPKVRNQLAKQFKVGSVEKTYLAITRGEVPTDEFFNEEPIGKPASSRIRIKKWVDPEGLPARTEFTVITRMNGQTLIAAYPKTGRTNQIRIHLAALGYPIVGDKLYHPDEEVFLLYTDGKDPVQAAILAGHSRLCLHAAGITFDHPLATNTKVHVQCLPPPGFSPYPEILESLRGETLVRP
jgi:RluA family pseudouridine synthase